MPVGILAANRTDCGRRREENLDLVLFDHAPEGSRVGPDRALAGA
jgi:hypothetical protein